MKLSLVIPIYNEEKIIDTLFNETTCALEQITHDFEIICVDDGSQDNSLQKLVTYHHQDPRLKVIALSRNFGHQAAYTAGLDYAQGDYVVMMDGDLQDPPELIQEMLAKAEAEHLDIVSGKRVSRQEKIPKRLLIYGFHFIFDKLSGLQDLQDTGNFALMNRRAIDALLSFKEKNRYLPGLRSFIGFRQGAVQYERRSRFEGKEKMNLSRLFKLAFDAIFSFSDVPIRLCLYIGLMGVIICVLAFFYVLLSKMMGIAPYGWSSTTLGIFFIGFIQLIFLGIMGEYLFRAYKETQGRPLYLIREFYG